MIRLEHGDAVYAFERFSDGEGRWTCVKGQLRKGVGRNTNNMLVPTELGAALTKAAIECGLGTFKDFSRWPIAPEKKKKKAVITSAKKDRISKIRGGFSLSSFFFESNEGEKNVDELDLDGMEVESVDSDDDVADFDREVKNLD